MCFYCFSLDRKLVFPIVWWIPSFFLPKIILLLLFSHQFMSDSLRPHGLQHNRLPCPSPSPRVCSNSCPLSQWCHPIISSSVTPFSSCLQSFQHQGLFQWVSPSHPMAKVLELQHQLFQWNQGWFPLELTGLISLLSKGMHRWSPKSLHNFLKIHYQSHSA